MEGFRGEPAVPLMLAQRPENNGRFNLIGYLADVFPQREARFGRELNLERSIASGVREIE
jgi:hypothetical protein